MVVDDEGRLVMRAGIRERYGLVIRTPLVLFEAPDGLVVLTGEQLRDRVRAELEGADLITVLLAEGRAAAGCDGAPVSVCDLFSGGVAVGPGRSAGGCAVVRVGEARQLGLGVPSWGQRSVLAADER